MAWVILNEPFFWPRPISFGAGASVTTLSASPSRLAQCIQSPVTGVLQGIRFAFGTITVAQDMTFALEGATSSLLPDDVETQTATYTPVGGDANTVKEITFGSGRALSRGEWFSVVLRWTSTTGTLSIVTVQSAQSFEPRTTEARGYIASWASSASQALALSLNYASGGYPLVAGTTPVPGFRSFINASIVINSGTSPDEVGNRIRLPFGGRLVGFYVYGPTTTANVDLTLYDSASNILSRMSIVNPNITSAGFFQVMLTTPVSVVAGDVVRVTLTGTNGTNTSVPRGVVDSNARLAAMPGGADINCYRTERTDGGSWTDTNTERLGFGVAYGAIDDGTGPATASWFPQGTILQEGPPIIIPGQG